MSEQNFNAEPDPREHRTPQQNPARSAIDIAELAAKVYDLMRAELRLDLARGGKFGLLKERINDRR